MAIPTFPQRRADEFEELLWQITGELALTPASASLAGAPFLEVDPDPEPDGPDAVTQTRRYLSRPFQTPRTLWVAGLAAACLIALTSFGVGQLTTAPAIVTALEMGDQSDEGAVMAVAHGPSIQIPNAPVREPGSAPATPDPEAEAETPEPAPKPKPRPKPKPKKAPAKPKPKASGVAFEDL